MGAVFTAPTFCLIAPYLASIFNSHRAIHFLSQTYQDEEPRKKIKLRSLSSSPPSPLHTSIGFVWEKGEAGFGFGS